MGSECYVYALPDYEFKITPEGNTPFQKLLAGNDRFGPLLRLLDDAFSVYPPDFFSRFRTSKYPDGLLILLVHGIYDIPGRTSDNITLVDGSDDVYSFIELSICPVTLLKDGLCYDADEKAF